MADATAIEAESVVLATGTATGQLAAQAGVGVPVDDPPGRLVSTEPVDPLLNGLVDVPGLELRQLAG